jgi:hypothetical protein
MKAAALEDNEWKEDARLAILRLSLTEPEFTADDLRRILRPAPVANWTGGAFTSARRAGLIEPINSTVSKSKSRNHGSLKTWRRKTEGAIQ